MQHEQSSYEVDSLPEKSKFTQCSILSDRAVESRKKHPTKFENKKFSFLFTVPIKSTIVKSSVKSTKFKYLICTYVEETQRSSIHHNENILSTALSCNNK